LQLPLHETFLAETRTQDNEYQEKSLEDKYGNITEFKDFKRRLWDVQHPNEPAPETWFTDPLAAVVPEDDDIVLDQEIQSLKCPLTLQLLEKPMRNTKCPHVYSLDAIRELVRHGGGQCLCPVSGCEAVITMAGIREDKVMARKVREEKAREEERFGSEGREVQDLNEGMSEVIYDDDDVKVERR
jgi:SUMO ligase MMS21 Smc5/6 complex component